jgi:hypothetical protein
VLGVEGTKISLTQDIEALPLDGALDEEGEELDREEERLLAQADPAVRRGAAGLRRGRGGGPWIIAGWPLRVQAAGGFASGRTRPPTRPPHTCLPPGSPPPPPAHSPPPLTLTRRARRARSPR